MSNISQKSYLQQVQDRAIECSDEAALVASVEGTIRKIVREFGRGLRSHEVEDLQAAGRLGALIAARKFDPTHERGANFNTFAVWRIRACVAIELFSLRSKGRCRRGKSSARVLYGYSRARHLIETSGKMPDIDAIASVLGVSSRAVLDSASVFFGADCGYDDPVAPGHSARVADVVADETQRDPLDVVVLAGDLTQLREAMKHLSEKSRYVLERRYFDEWSSAEVGRSLGVTREAARQIEIRALSRLRKRMAA